jgi:hypothetical protein
MFSGGSYDEVARWLQNFLTSHAKRENVHAEIELDAGEARGGTSYGARVRLGERLTPVEELEWCATLAARTRAMVRDLAAAA